MRHLDEQHGEVPHVVSDLAALGQQVLELQAQLAALVPAVVDDPRARESLAHSRAAVTDMHLRAWQVESFTSSCPQERTAQVRTGRTHQDEGRR